MSTPDTPLVRLENQSGMALVLTYADGDRATIFIRDVYHLEWDFVLSWQNAIYGRLVADR